MEKMKKIIAARSNEDLLKDWEILDAKESTTEVVTLRGLYMDEIEKRWPAEFDEWIDSCEKDDDIRSYIKL